MDWNSALARTEALAARHRAVGDLLRFCKAVLRFQQEVYLRTRARVRADARYLDTPLLSSFFPDLLQLVETHGPGPLGSEVERFRDRDDWEAALRECWKRPGRPGSFLPRLVLQPYALYLSERWARDVGGLDAGSGTCPFCARPPLVSLQNGQRLLCCSFCGHQWKMPEPGCPGCGRRRLRTVRRRQYAHLRVEACDGCGRYLKRIDLDRDPRAVAMVDEVAGVELDRAAQARGYRKFERNIAGL